VILVLTLFSPLVNATPSGLTYTGSTWSYDATEGSIIALNGDSTILAAAHDNEVALYDTSNLHKIASFEFERISTLEFSNDGSLLAVSKGATFTVRESLKIIDIDDSIVLSQEAVADDKAVDIAWSIDDTVLAAPGESGDVDLFRTNDMTLKATLSGVHNSDVTCIDYSSDGNWIITGDESGRYAIWDVSDSQLVGSYMQHGTLLTDCMFTPDSNSYLIINELGEIIRKGIDGQHQDSHKIDGAKQLLFSHNGQRVHVAYSTNMVHGLVTLDIIGLVEATQTSFFHQVYDAEIIDDELSRITTIFVAGGVGGIATYRSELLPLGYGQPGKDTDKDFVPDILDEDDDGDGLNDQWDNDIGCDSPEDVPCSEFPNLAKIRKADFHFEEGILTISDHITLPPVPSSSIRNLSRLAQHDDHKISELEADLFADAMCENMDDDDIIEQWRESITLSSGALGTGRVHCTLYGGMVMVQETDSITQITITIVTTFLIQSVVEYPLNMTLSGQPEPTDGSISWLAPAHPMSVSMHGEGGIMSSVDIWVNDGETLNLSMKELPKPVESNTEKAFYILAHPIALAIYLVLSMIGLLYLVRRDNKIDLDLDDEEEEIEDFKFDNDLDIEEDGDNDSFDSSPPQRRTPPKRKPPKRTPPKSKPDFGNSDSKFTGENEGVKVRRRSTSRDINTDGPIMRTKRRRLGGDSDNDNSNVVAKKKIVSSSSVSETPIVRTRKVKKAEPEPVVKEKSRRKAVRRKKKPSKDKKKIDEDALQSDLLKGFIDEGDQ
jgi:hypothetical protein